MGRGVSYSSALRWPVVLLLILIVLTLGLKWVGHQTTEQNEKDVQSRVAEFLIHQHFSVVVSKDSAEGEPTVRATAPGCRMLLINSPVLGWDRDMVRRNATAADRVFVVFRGRVYPDRPTWLIASDFLWSRFLRGLGLKVQSPPLLTVIAPTSCAAEGLPWNQLQ